MLLRKKRDDGAPTLERRGLVGHSLSNINMLSFDLFALPWR